MAGYRGATPLGALYHGDVKLGAGWTYRGGQWVQVYAAWSDAGMTKVGEYTLARSGWEAVSGWGPHPSYPDTVVTGDGIEVPAGTYLITAQLTYSSAGGNSGQGVRVTSDGAAVPGLSYMSGYTNETQYTVSDTVDVAASVLRVEGNCDSFTASRRTIVTDSWLTVTRAG